MPRSLSNPTQAAATKPAPKEKDRDPVAAGRRDASFNRSASFNYFLTDRFEAGVALRGTDQPPFAPREYSIQFAALRPSRAA